MKNPFSIFRKNKNDNLTHVYGNVFRDVKTGVVVWGGNSFDPEYLLGLNVHDLHRKCLEMWWKSIHMQAAVKQLTTLTINTGLTLQSIPLRRFLGLDRTEIKEKSKHIEDLFELARHQKSISHDGLKTFNELEIVAAQSKFIFNEYFAVLKYKLNDPVTPLRIQLINPMAVKSPPNLVLNANQKIDRGIEFKSGVPVAFWVENIADGSLKYTRVPFLDAKGRTVGIHQFNGVVPGQVRGISRFAPQFHEFQRVLESLKLEMDTMGTHASLAAFVERDKDVVDPDKIKRVLMGQESLNDVPKTVEEIDKKTVITRTGGMIIHNGEPGERMVPFDTKRPNINIPDFINKHMEWIGPAIGLPFTVWRALFNSNYSASTGENSLAWNALAVEIYCISSGLHKAVLHMLINAKVAQGQIVLPGWTDPIMRTAWLHSVWRGIPQPTLNGFVEAKASTERIKNGTSNGELESQKATGTSFEENRERSLEDIEYSKELVQQYADAGIDISIDSMRF